jgi:hypothetical protein
MTLGKTMKSNSDIPFFGEKYSCECEVEVTGSFGQLLKTGFRCKGCDRPIKCSLILNNNEVFEFRRVDANCVEVGDIMILGHPNLNLHHEVLGITLTENCRIVGLKRHGGYRVPFDTAVCIIPLEWR